MKLLRGDTYQFTLILSGVIASVLFGYFLYRELFPEYKIYQNDYIALEKFRSEYTHEPAPDFGVGVKQLILERPDKGNPVIDRCISCHVALEFPHFSPTKVAYDNLGHVIYDEHSLPKKIENEDYIWKKIDQKIAALEDSKVLAQLQGNGEQEEIENRHQEADRLKALKVAHVGDVTYDVTKVLRMHPLMGKETRPFEFHPLEEYGCVSCHNGNGRGLTTETAHGPVFDGQYEKEFMGPEPEFTESDPQNDPTFASVFNGKPGHALLFQTTPLYVGALIQAKCVQCHQPENDASEAYPPSTRPSDIDPLINNYLAGEQLFISQACYACHRISGFARGGVGPELTQEGYNYPWFVKQSIVWPQADLASSTMPNYVLDHKELENLLTFLLAQTGESAGISKTAQKSSLQAWEAGKRLPWETPSSPVQIQDLRYAMTVFATEGCAACHRLKGFEANAGFSIEKDRPDERELLKEKEWFLELFPEDSSGSLIVKTVEANKEEIDKRIVDDVRKNSLLDDIDKKFSGLIMSFYSPFRYAYRAKNKEYTDLNMAEKDPEKKKLLINEQKEWKKRIHRLAMMFVQEYGLGRLIGPKPNWSGVFRTDEWLFEHFKNPGLHVPRSIMPIFPFDDTKFYALTHMLDALGVRNRNATRSIWEHEGFNPQRAYQIHCSQCHGDFLQGNGPVAKWIYPIPKNLRNADFLRNLTRKKVVESIVNGVRGTPMPPWGEIAADKPYLQDIPVLTSSEIESLVDWLFLNLPGGNVIRGSEDVPKWNYHLKDVIGELKHEGSLTKLKLNGDQSSALFDVQSNKDPESDFQGYYIKSEYLTPDNVEAGRKFFELNCAVCHGKAGDGAGARAGTMTEAKPRMLTNLDWIQTHDDLRLLRSIKYGVPGTSMTPWGDQTSALQRIQLVAFIRSLTEERALRSQLAETLYQVFDTEAFFIETVRETNYGDLEKTRLQYEELQKVIKEANVSDNLSEEQHKEIIKLFDQQISLEKNRKAYALQDRQYVKLAELVKRERDAYQKVGQSIVQENNRELLNMLTDLIVVLKGRFQGKDNVLVDTFSSSQEKELKQREEQIQELLENEIKNLEAHQNEKKEDEIQKGIELELSAIKKLKEELKKTFIETAELRQKERGVINSILKK